MSGKQWLTVFAVELLTNPIMLAIVLIFSAVLFFSAYAILVSLGMVSALIYTLLSLGFIWLVGSVNQTILEKHWWMLFLVPLAFIFGWVTDHFQVLGLSWSQKIAYGAAWGAMDTMNGQQTMLIGYMTVGVMLALFAVLVLVLSVIWSKRKHKKR